ncbi:aminodeoxychorismate/anthranilate synthase component II [Rhodocytophaga rosea]|uniref:Aminodeoxychorismate/anthranilate synthase component II n=1 Tax=Rhodocytophaga rosea TaxID=2704465 RepID=A0A6C0GKY1_9BACT|nr:aminodeoxychorismate/anthranilate synthase component II [Rhodocytophaga rosea]QHT68665.1 aminodeoxychorismate/anthranilate synthase component II [Rhodocytophaga rosea]
MKILVLDNYDSFTYNLVHLLKELGLENSIEVHRNDKISLEEVEKFDKILLSPGPGLPSEAGIMPELIRKYAPSKSILGICLGHQGISEIFGAKLENMTEVLHGVATKAIVTSNEERIFNNIPKELKTCRYHSWTVVPESVPANELEITAIDENGKVMAIRHKQYDVRGLQFHPESILTEHGKQMIQNWLEGD